MNNRRWLIALLLAVALEAATALTIRSALLGDFLRGQRDLRTTVGAAGLLWVPLLVVAAFGVGHALLTTRGPARREESALVDVATISHDWVWTADCSMRLTSSNGRVTELLGYQPAELLGRSLLSLLDPTDGERAHELLAVALSGGHGWDDVELSWVHQNGQLVVLQDSARPVLDASGSIVGFGGTNRLVTRAMVSERSLSVARQRIDEALLAGAVDIALQPIISLADGQLAGVEALARFRDGRSPEAWFAEARETGRSRDLDLLCFQAALQLLPSLPAGTYLSVNATPELILDGALPTALLEVGPWLSRVVLEITEHVQITCYDALHEALTPLRAGGLRLAIDDTGAGYASLKHVLQLRPDIIKIDRSLITRIGSDPARRTMVTALVLLAMDLDASVTAECVETASELDTLLSLGVDHLQGYLLGHPTTDRARWAGWWNRTWLPTALVPASRTPR